MDDQELLAAMKFGSKNPSSERGPHDLGRFGLGLKTASLSQCRLVVVVSRKKGQTSAKYWDLGHVSRVDSWELLEGLPPGNHEEVLQSLEHLDHGTVVVWRDLDRVITSADARDQRARDSFLEHAERVVRHLEMVFHRFLEGPRPRLNIYIQNQTRSRRLRPWDPFLRDHLSTFSTPVDSLDDGGGYVRVQGFILPHKDLLSREEYENAAGPEGWTAQQGFYVYRNDRMLVGGSWLGLGRERAWTKEEPFKLARLSLDFSNRSDAEWQIDIKKSKARPPYVLRPRLRDLAEQVRRKSRHVVYYRMKTSSPPGSGGDFSPVWQVGETRYGMKFRINRGHPLIGSVLQGADSSKPSFEAILKLLETTVPVRRLWDEEGEERESDGAGFSEDERQAARVALRPLMRFLVEKLKLSPAEARSRLSVTEPFNRFPDLVAEISAE